MFVLSIATFTFTLIRHASTAWKELIRKSLCLPIFRNITENVKKIKSLHGFGGQFHKGLYLECVLLGNWVLYLLVWSATEHNNYYCHQDQLYSLWKNYSCSLHRLVIQETLLGLRHLPWTISNFCIYTSHDCDQLCL